MSTMSLTEEQIRRCEENRKRALAIRALKTQQTFNKCNETSKANSFTASAGQDSSITKQVSHFYSSKLPAKYNATQKTYLPKSAPTDNTVALSFKKIVGTCSMISCNRFQVEMEYHSPSVDIFKTIPGSRYDALVKRWNFDIQSHDRLIADMKKISSALIGGVPRNVLDVFKDTPESKSNTVADLSRLNSTITEALMPFQKEGVHFGIAHSGRVIIADDMGLGKTIQAIAISEYYKSEWPVLVVTPSSVRYAWEEAFHKWLPQISKSEINIINTKRENVQEGKVVILSYDMLSKKEKDVTDRNFKVVIFDESHFLKNFKSARTKAAQNIVKQSKRVLLLSGTPALSRPVELYTQISLVNPRLFQNFPAFGLRYCDGKQMAWGWDYSGSSNMKELHLILEETLLIRRLKSDVMAQLPDKQRQMILLDPALISGDKKSFQALSQEMSKPGMVGRGVLLQFFHSTGLAKIKAVCHYISELLEGEQKFICFAHHQQVLNGICDLLFQRKCDFVRIDGCTSAENRKVYCDKFQYNEQCKVAVLSITAANAGINLTAAHLVVFAELYWNPGILTQAEDRAHRIGQEDCVIVQYLVAQGTADDHIWPMVQKKLDTLSKAGLSKDNFNNSECIGAPKSNQQNKSSANQETLDHYFKKLCDDDDAAFWDDVSFDDLIEESEAKKVKL